MVVMAGWFVGLCVLVLFFFFLFNLKFWIETFPMLGGGHPHKKVLVLAFWGGGPEQVNTAYVLCRLHPPLPLPLLLGYCYFPLLC